MQLFSGRNYLKIDVANTFGLDKKLWQERIDWVDQNADILESFIDDAKEQMLFAKAVNAYREAEANQPIGHLMGLDCTASGLQVLAVLIGCKKTAQRVNLINTGKREDVYEYIAERMSEITGTLLTKETIKTPVMTKCWSLEA